MASIEYMRNDVKELYPGDRWARRVKQMPDHQVMAIYMRRIGEPEKKPDDEKPPQNNDIPF
jgi:hypothetical protein